MHYKRAKNDGIMLENILRIHLQRAVDLSFLERQWFVVVVELLPLPPAISLPPSSSKVPGCF
jgi:hypothetical protein